MLKREKAAIKEQLDNELKNHHFTKQQDVLNRIYPITWKQKFSAILNKEIELPLIPISAVCMLLLVSIGTKEFIFDDSKHIPQKNKVLIEVGGNIYWKDELEKVVVMYED